MEQSENKPIRMYTQEDMDTMISIQRALAWKIIILTNNTRLGLAIPIETLDAMIEETRIALKKTGLINIYPCS